MDNSERILIITLNGWNIKWLMNYGVFTIGFTKETLKSDLVTGGTPAFVFRGERVDFGFEEWKFRVDEEFDLDVFKDFLNRMGYSCTARIEGEI